MSYPLVVYLSDLIEALEWLVCMLTHMCIHTDPHTKIKVAIGLVSYCDARNGVALYMLPNVLSETWCHQTTLTQTPWFKL